MKIRSLFISLLVVSAGCSEKAGQPDAYGNFEATEVTVSAETGGRIIRLAPEEGTLVEKGAEIALIDTTLLNLQKNEIEAALRSAGTRIRSINAQNDILVQQIDNLNINISRFGKMLKDSAATQKQYDDLAGQAAVFEKQIAANNTQKATVNDDLEMYRSKIATINEQISRCHVKSPLNGTVIEKYSEPGELTAAGKPLVKVADLSEIKLKAYVSGAQLGKVKIGQECTVRIDDGKKGYRTFPGTVSYVSEKAEFTPKIIQTKEERVILVYAVTILVKNDGTIKSGMPGEALFQ
jgi:HlyD family secretion protein